MNSALQPVTAALLHVLNVPSLVGPYVPNVCAGVTQIYDHPPRNVETADFPFVWIELAGEDATRHRGLGRGLWLLELDIRLHTFSIADGMAESERITTEMVRLLRTHDSQTLPVTGWNPWYQPHDRVVALPFELLAGRPVTELVNLRRLFVEES